MTITKIIKQTVQSNYLAHKKLQTTTNSVKLLKIVKLILKKLMIQLHFMLYVILMTLDSLKNVLFKLIKACTIFLFSL